MLVSRQFLELKNQGLQRKEYKEAGIAKEGLWRSQDNKGKITKKQVWQRKNEQRFVAIRQYLNITKSLQGGEAATQNVLSKAFLKIAQILQENLFARFSVTGVFLWTLCNF